MKIFEYRLVSSVDWNKTPRISDDPDPVMEAGITTDYGTDTFAEIVMGSNLPLRLSQFFERNRVTMMRFQYDLKAFNDRKVTNEQNELTFKPPPKIGALISPFLREVDTALEKIETPISPLMKSSIRTHVEYVSR